MLRVGILLLFAGVLGLIVYAVVDEITADKFSLRKDSWTCTASHTETSTTYIEIGKVMVPQFHSNVVCDQWTAR